MRERWSADVGLAKIGQPAANVRHIAANLGLTGDVTPRFLAASDLVRFLFVPWHVRRGRLLLRAAVDARDEAGEGTTMLNRFFAAAMAALMLTTACSIPDGDDMGDLSNALRAMPPPDLRVVRDHRSNARIRAWINEFPNAHVGMFACREQLLGEQDYIPGKTLNVIRDHLRAAAEGHPDWSLKQILDSLESLLRPLAEEKLFNTGDFNNPCTLEWSFNPGAYEEALEWERGEHDDYIDDAEDSAFWLPTLDTDSLKKRPLLLTVLGLAVVGGVVVISVTNPVVLALCPKSRDIECPGDPLSPGGSPVNPNGTPGGDR
jgi:hypothetical protein